MLKQDNERTKETIEIVEKEITDLTSITDQLAEIKR